jgi:hypothetical protein
MKWRSVCVVILAAATMTAGEACNRSTPIAGCPSGHSPYSAADIALDLVQNDSGHSFRLPLGKVVTGALGWCASGDALESLGSELPSTTPGRGHGAAFRAVKPGEADIYLDLVCSETCLKPFRVRITVTNGCQVLSETEEAKLYSAPNSSWTSVTSTAKLVHASDYERAFGLLLDVPPDKTVWAVLVSGQVNAGAVVDPSPGPIMWAAAAVDPCTDHMLFGWWEGTSPPAAWSSLAEQSPN